MKKNQVQNIIFLFVSGSGVFSIFLIKDEVAETKEIIKERLEKVNISN